MRVVARNSKKQMLPLPVGSSDFMEALSLVFLQKVDTAHCSHRLCLIVSLLYSQPILLQGSYTFSKVKFKHFQGAFSSFSSTLWLW